MKKNNLDLRGAVPPMPASFVNRMNDTLKEIDHMKKRSKFTIALVAAVVAALALASVAVAQAIDSGILTRLFGSNEPSSEALGLLQTDINTYVQDGMTLNIDELLFDGRSVNCQWTVASDREDALFILTEYEVAGVAENLIESENSRGAEASMGVGDNTLVMLGGADGLEQAQEYIAVNFTEPLTSQASIVLTLHAFTTDLTPVELDGIYPEADVCAVMEQAGQIGVYEGHVWLTEYPAFANAVEAALPDRENAPVSTHDFDQANLDAHTESGLMKKAFDMTVTIPLEAREDSVTVFGPQTFELDDCTLEISRLSFSAASTTMEMKVYPKTAAEAGEFLAKYRFAVGADGNPWLMNQYGSLETAEDGRQVYIVSLDGQPVAEIPAELTLIRMDERREGEAPLAQYRRLLSEMSEGRTAVMNLN